MLDIEIFALGIIFGTLLHILHFQFNRSLTLRRLAKECNTYDDGNVVEGYEKQEGADL
jgi:hypothetical protein